MSLIELEAKDLDKKYVEFFETLESLKDRGLTEEAELIAQFFDEVVAFYNDNAAKVVADLRAAKNAKWIWLLKEHIRENPEISVNSLAAILMADKDFESKDSQAKNIARMAKRVDAQDEGWSNLELRYIDPPSLDKPCYWWPGHWGGQYRF